jgi:hypothetical protein
MPPFGVAPKDAVSIRLSHRRCPLILRLLILVRVHREKESTSFLKKRSKKLLIPCGFILNMRAPKETKVFGSFFQKRTRFLSHPANRRKGIVMQ